MLGHPTPWPCPARQGRCRARERVLPAAMTSGQPSSHTGQRGLTCAMAPRLLTGHKFSTEEGNLGGFQIPLYCLPLRTTLGCIKRKTIPDLPESQPGCAARLSPKWDFGSSRCGNTVSSSKGPSLASKRHPGVAAEARRVHGVRAWGAGTRLAPKLGNKTARESLQNRGDGCCDGSAA